jgi:hypothetical protein
VRTRGPQGKASRREIRKHTGKSWYFGAERGRENDLSALVSSYEIKPENEKECFVRILLLRWILSKLDEMYDAS